MSGFRKILLTFDNSKNSKRALKKAVELAQKSGGKLTIVHVISYHKTVAKIVGPYKGKLVDTVTKFLDSAQKTASSAKVSVDTKILYGNAAEEILKFSKKKNFDIIIVGKRGTNIITGPTLGSVSNALIQQSGIPVMVVK